jgi:tetratricopeptide (TPR) repeat protein
MSNRSREWPQSAGTGVVEMVGFCYLAQSILRNRGWPARMPHSYPHTIWLVWLAVLLGGCRLPGHNVPISQPLATCRQLTRQGVTAMERGQPQQAEELLAKAVKSCPTDSEARRYYAEALWQRGARQDAITQLKEAGRQAGEDAALEARLAEMHLAMGNVELARQSAEHAIDLNPKLAAAWAMRGRVMRVTGQPQQSLIDWHRALDYAPDDRSVLTDLAELHRQLNQPQRALQTLQSLADTYPPGEEPQQVLYLVGMAYMALDRYQDAVENLSAAAVRDKPSPELLYCLGEAQLSCGRPAEAASAAQYALALQPNHRPSQELLGRIELAARQGPVVR